MQTSDSTQPPASGNPTQFDGGDLWDIVQVTCLSGARRVLQVEAAGAGTGHLFFCGGQVVHATLGEQEGEGAALTLLTMRGGRCDTCSQPFPAAATVQTPWQGLLLQAAQLLDERRLAGRDSGVQWLDIESAGEGEEATVLEVVALVDQPSLENLDEDVLAITMETESEGMAASNEPPPASAQDATLNESEYRQLAWIDGDGEVLQEQGDDPGFAGRAAYAVRMAELIGDLLSLGEFVALEFRDGSCSRIAYADGWGGVVACVPAAPETATMLRRRLAL